MITSSGIPTYDPCSVLLPGKCFATECAHHAPDRLEVRRNEEVEQVGRVRLGRREAGDAQVGERVVENGRREHGAEARMRARSGRAGGGAPAVERGASRKPEREREDERDRRASARARVER